MILADKIIKLRKKNGWSQEELAEKMNVSRQAVSKWECVQTIPDIEKILQLSLLFGVTTDYLLKDEIEDKELTYDSSDDTTVKKISTEEAITYIEQRKKAAWLIALAIFLWFVSPITFIILSMLSELPDPIITESMAGAVGFTVLFVLALCAILIYIYCGFKNQSYNFFDNNAPFELEYGAKSLLTEKKKAFRPTYIAYNIIATCLCIISILPLISLSFMENEAIIAVILSLLMVMAGIGAGMFIVVRTQNTSIQKLLKEGVFTNKKKKITSVKSIVRFCYLSFLVAIYLAVTFLTNDWHSTWIILVVGSVLFPIVMYICNYIAGKQMKV